VTRIREVGYQFDRFLDLICETAYALRDWLTHRQPELRHGQQFEPISPLLLGIRAEPYSKKEVRANFVAKL